MGVRTVAKYFFTCLVVDFLFVNGRSQSASETFLAQKVARRLL